MIFDSRRLRNQNPLGRGAAAGDDRFLRSLRRTAIRFDQLGGGHATLIHDVTVNIPVASIYESTLNVGPLNQMMVAASTQPGRAIVQQGTTRVEKPVNVGDVISTYLESGEARVRVEMPVTGNGLGAQAPELVFGTVGAHSPGAVILISANDWLAPAGEVPADPPIPEGVPGGAPVGPADA